MERELFWEIYGYGEKEAVVTTEGTYTYRHMAEICRKIKSLVPQRSLIFHKCSLAFGSIAGFVAFANSFQVQLLLDEGTEEETLDQLIKLYCPGYLYVKRQEECLFPDYRPVAHIQEYVLLQTDCRTGYGLHEDLALLVTTSGSTGSRKYVRLSYQNIRSNAESILAYLHLDSSQRAMLTLPISYSYGLAIMVWHLCVGATLLVSGSSILQKGFWDFFVEQGATYFGGTPYVYEMLGKMGFFNRKLPGLRRMTQSGGKLPPQVYKRYAEYARENHVEFYATYGQTEATGGITYLPYQEAVRKEGSIGIAIPGGRLALVDDRDREIEDADTPGELVWHSPCVSLGYAEGAADLEKGDERKGILYTGDIGYRDREGFYYLVGRKRRIIKMFGKRISLDETERLVRERFRLEECCCMGRDNELTVVVTVRDRQAGEEIGRYLAGKLKLREAFIQVKYMGEIPRMETGKVDYTRLDGMCMSDT